ncbi:MAG: hypothetical protein OXH06_08685 [Gemmatimonadetes bacterium]|nr:hypothetical protein [Gemmatimonadota bacterium]
MPQPRMMFYHDGRHPLIYMYEPPMQKEEFEAGVDELAGTPVDAIMFCLGDGRTFLHDTKVGEIWGHNVNDWPHLIFDRASRNAMRLIREGHDPLRLICDRAHEKGMLVYPTLLVQQGRGDRGEDVRCSDFRFENTHLEIGARGDLDPEFPGLTCLDFTHSEVREERFAIVEETLNVYPVDGFELQLNYTPYYFHPDVVEDGSMVMTEWIARIHRAVKNSGRERELAIRIPASIQGCLQVGLDVREWLRLGIVDVLIGQTFSTPELLDSTVDFGELVDAAEGTGCRVHAALHSHVDSDRLAEATIEMIRGAACNYWAQGVDGLYMAHWFGNWPYQASFYEKLRELPHADVMAPKDKHYYVPTETGRYPRPVTEPGVAMGLPTALTREEPAHISIRVSDDLPRWDETGRVHDVLLRVRIMNATEKDRFRFRLNGKELPDAQLRRINEMYRMSAPRYRTGSGYWFVFRPDRANWPRQGRNELEVGLLERDPDVTPDVYVRDLELEIRYLMGRSYHRMDDPDLGPSEPTGE